jgi:hypothetical protein
MPTSGGGSPRGGLGDPIFETEKIKGVNAPKRHFGPRDEPKKVDFEKWSTRYEPRVWTRFWGGIDFALKFSGVLRGGYA